MNYLHDISGYMSLVHSIEYEPDWENGYPNLCKTISMLQHGVQKLKCIHHCQVHDRRVVFQR